MQTKHKQINLTLHKTCLGKSSQSVKIVCVFAAFLNLQLNIIKKVSKVSFHQSISFIYIDKCILYILCLPDRNILNCIELRKQYILSIVLFQNKLKYHNNTVWPFFQRKFVVIYFGKKMTQDFVHTKSQKTMKVKQDLKKGKYLK